MAPVGLPPASGDGLAYWRARVQSHGARAVLNLDHGRGIDDVTVTHRAQLLPALAALLPSAPGRPGARTVLDLGCGSGRLTGSLAAVAGRAIGVDPVSALLARAPSGPAVEYRPLLDPDRLPLADGEVAVAFTCLVLGGVSSSRALGALCDELRRVLAPGGVVLLAESVSDQPAAAHWTFRSVADYAAALPWAGLQEVARFDDAGDPVSVMAGRKPATEGRRV